MFRKLLLRLLGATEPASLPDEPIDVSDKVRVWGINAGPFHRDEVDDPHVPDELEYMLVCKIEVDGEITVQEFWFSSLEDANIWVDHFYSKIEPIEVNYG